MGREGNSEANANDEYYRRVSKNRKQKYYFKARWNRIFELNASFSDIECTNRKCCGIYDSRKKPPQIHSVQRKELSAIRPRTFAPSLGLDVSQRTAYVIFSLARHASIGIYAFGIAARLRRARATLRLSHSFARCHTREMTRKRGREREEKERVGRGVNSSIAVSETRL